MAPGNRGKCMEPEFSPGESKRTTKKRSKSMMDSMWMAKNKERETFTLPREISMKETGQMAKWKARESCTMIRTKF